MADDLFRVEMLPALHGDCLFVEYGNEDSPRRMLIDGGPIGAYDALEARLAALPAGKKRLELLVLSHVDTDHAEGLIRLLANQPLPVKIEEVWFNGWRHLEQAHGLLGGKQGEFLSALLSRRLRPEQWNTAFQGQAVVAPADAPLPEVTLAGGMKLTLLSPTPEGLDKMKKAWRAAMSPGMAPGDLDAAWRALGKRKAYLPGQGLLGTTPQMDQLLEKQLKVDDSQANASSIAFLAELGDKSCLFLADAHRDVIIASLQRLLAQRGLDRLPVSAVKVAHHGSAGNLNDELLGLVDSPRFLLSTNGDIFHHPDAEAVQRIIARAVHQPPTLYFNYLSDTTQPWQDAALQAQLDFRAEFNPDNEQPFVIEL
ncbi:MAG: MBL fold metallo-hydrolase [Deltaproteobacteria bacterium]|nr:MBL fold metallo-hydrolase [Deltaproteobacteria bacterium]